MYAYCNNNPANAKDPSGHVLLRVGIYDDPTLNMFFGSGGNGGGSGGYSATVASLASSFLEKNHYSGELEKTERQAGVWDGTKRILPWEITLLSCQEGLTLIDASVALVDVSYQLSVTEDFGTTLTLMRAFSVEASAEITAKDGVHASAMAKMVSSSFSFDFSRITVSFTGYLGAVGAEAGVSVDGFIIGIANGLGGKIEVQRK